jgi:hypothetical protein
MHNAGHWACCETEPKPDEKGRPTKHGFMWWPEGTGPAWMMDA